MTNNPVIDAALIRAFIISVLIGALTVLTTRQLDIEVVVNGVKATINPDWEECLIAGGVSFIGALLLRGFGEGGYDAHRASVGNINDSDVPVASDKHVVRKKKED